MLPVVNTMFNVTIDFTGATLVTTSAPTISGLVSHNGATTTFTATISAPCASTTPLVNKILLSKCSISDAENGRPNQRPDQLLARDGRRSR